MPKKRPLEDYIPLSSSPSSAAFNKNEPQLNHSSIKKFKPMNVYGDFKIMQRLDKILTEIPLTDVMSLVKRLQKDHPEYRRKTIVVMKRLVMKAIELYDKELDRQWTDKQNDDINNDAIEDDSFTEEENDTIKSNNSMNKSLSDLYVKGKRRVSFNESTLIKENDVSNKSVKTRSKVKSDKKDMTKIDKEIDTVLTNHIKLKERFLITPHVTFDNFGGISKVIEQIKKTMLHLRHPSLYKFIGIESPRGFLLYGPPGVGKTMLVEAIAADLNVPLIKCGATEIIGGISGESEEKIRDLFSFAKSFPSCLLFIDEIDAITPKRENAAREMERRIVTQLLTCLDNLTNDDTSNVMVIGATNRPDAIDPALRRAGRFDKEIGLGIPDESARLEIIEVLCKGIKLCEGFDFNSLAHKTPGYVGADLKSLIHEAAVFALNRAFQEKHIDIITSQIDDSLAKEIHSVLSIDMNDFEAALKQIQPSSKREGFATVPDVTWNDVGALSNIREELQLSILAPIHYQSEVKALGLSTSVGILMCGPPGCGKTLLAKAIANESGINFISVKGPELLNMYVGESERAVRSVFNRARDSKPCVIFFDEIDALCPKRSESDSSNVSSRVVNQLLTEMDGLESRNCFLLAATNRPDILDPAILRPGRFDKILYVDFPTPEDRYEILRTLSKDGTTPPLASDVDLLSISKDRRLNGFTGADLNALLREGSLYALKQRIKEGVSNESIHVTSIHIEYAINKVKPSISENERKRYELLKQNLKFSRNL